MKYLSALLLVLIMISCNKKEESNNVKFPDTVEILGLASTIQLNYDETTVYLSDYFVDPSKIESISFSTEIDFEYKKELQEIDIIAKEDLPNLFTLNVSIDGFDWKVMVKKSEKIKYNYEFDPKGKEYETVQIKGEMCAWNPNEFEMTFEDGVYKTSFLAEPGDYQYCLMLNGKEKLDPNNPDSVDNNIGGFNSVLQVGDDMKEKPQLFTLAFDGNKVEVGSLQKAEYFVFWNNFSLSFDVDESNKIDFEIPGQAENIDRSYIRVWAYNENGVSNDLLIPLNQGKVLTSSGELHRMDKESMVLYNVFVDRFYNADETNDKPVLGDEVLPQANNFGGDIKGATQKIKDGYFKELGINSIWISPVVKNVKGAFGYWPEPESKFSAYHGYWPVSFTEVDDRMGTEEDLHELVKVAHENDMNIFLDFVANHVHENHPVYKANPDWATELYLPDGTLNTERWDDHRLTTWFDVFLPTLDLAKPEVYNMLSDSAVYWIKKYGFDGFRHDATKHIPEIFWRTLTRKLKDEVIIPEVRPLYQIGETYGTRALVGSYVASGQLDAQFDFNVYDAAVAAFAKKETSLIDLNKAVQKSFKYFGHHHLMGNISGNQDRGRFISYAGGDLFFDEDAKAAGWTREIGVGKPIAYKRIEMLMAFNMTIPGIPVIYYGDEIGMPGGNDPDNRRMMRFDNLKKKENGVKETTQKLISLRTSNIPLMYGDFETLHESDSMWVYARTYFDQIAIVALNKGRNKKDIEFELPSRYAEAVLEANFGSNLKQNKTKVSINVSGTGFEILTN